MTTSVTSFVVKPVYSDHFLSPKIVAVDESWWLFDVLLQNRTKNDGRCRKAVGIQVRLYSDILNFQTIKQQSKGFNPIFILQL